MQECNNCKYLAADGIRCSLVDAKHFPFPKDAPCLPEVARQAQIARKGLAHIQTVRELNRIVKFSESEK